MLWQTGSKKSRAVSTIVASVIMILIFLTFITFIYTVLDRIARTTEFSLEAVSSHAEAQNAVQSVKGWWLKEGDKLVIHVENQYSKPVSIVGLAIIFDNSSYILIDSKSTGVNITVALPSNNVILNYTASALPLGLGTGYAANITIPLAGSEPSVITLAVSPSSQEGLVLSPAVGNIMLPNYYELYPYTRPTMLYAPAVFDDYTVASIGYSSATPLLIPPTGYEVNTGTLVSGDLGSLISDDDDMLILSPSVTTTYSFPTYSDWQYYRLIRITERTGGDLADYTLKIVLNSSNFDFSLANSDGSDIRFLDNDNTTLLNYWIQKWDRENQEAIIWVKIPQIPAGSTKTIYMLYGNPSATFDSQHYGLTKVMETLPASDGANYRIVYEEWVMPTQLFSTLGSRVLSGWYDDAGVYLWFPIAFPFYDQSYTGLYACVNGFLTTSSDTCSLSESTVDGLISENMIAPFWADLVLYGQYSGLGIYYDSSYSDEYGDGVYIRWRTSFGGYVSLLSDKTGVQNFAVVLYSNGLIRFDYGDIYGTSWVDHTQVVGVSLGDGVHYTVSSYTYEYLGDYPDNYPSVMFWPRKKAVVEPVVSVDPSNYKNRRDTYNLVVTLGWDGVTPATVEGALIKGYLGSTQPLLAKLVVYENSTGSWQPLSQYILTGDSAYDLSITVDKYYSSGTVGLQLWISAPSSFSLGIDYAVLRQGLRISDPLLCVAVNGSSRLYLYDVSTGLWDSMGVPSTVFKNPALAFDYNTLSLLIVNGTHLLSYSFLDRAFMLLAELPVPSSSDAFVMPLGDYILYAPGGRSTDVYLYDPSTGGFTKHALPENVNMYTSTAYDHVNNIGYILFGVSGNLYNVTIVDGSIVTKLIMTTPVAYPVGLDYGGGLLWLMSRGGGLYKINVTSATASSLNTFAPYYPISNGDRLVYVETATGPKLYHIREDGTSEIWVISFSS